MGWVRFLANFGMLGLMFMAGFEVDVRRLRTTWRASVTIGVLSLAFPMAGVFATAYFFFGLPLMAAGLVAIALSTTSLALVYHALKERSLLGESTGQVLLASASVVDVLSMVSLSLLLGDVVSARVTADQGVGEIDVPAGDLEVRHEPYDPETQEVTHAGLGSRRDS